MTINANDIAWAVLHYAQSPRRGRCDAGHLNENYFSTASRSAVTRAIRDARDLNMIVDQSHHGARPDWVPSRPYLLDEIKRLQERIAFAKITGDLA